LTEEFCHPIKVSGTNMTKDQWALCVSKTNAAECSTASVSGAPQCVWNIGADLIPENDYCAPKDLT